MSDDQLALLQKMRYAAMELAAYASYAEIIGAVHHNKHAIREWCDIIYETEKELKEFDEDEY